MMKLVSAKFKVTVIDKINKKENNKTRSIRACRRSFQIYVHAFNGPFLLLIHVFSKKLLSTNYADVIFSETFVYSKRHLTIKTLDIRRGPRKGEDFRITQ